MLDYLANEKSVTNKQAIGYIKLNYQNNIGLVDCPLTNLLKFDAKFGHYWGQIC